MVSTRSVPAPTPPRTRPAPIKTPAMAPSAIGRPSAEGSVTQLDDPSPRLCTAGSGASSGPRSARSAATEVRAARQRTAPRPSAPPRPSRTRAATRPIPAASASRAAATTSRTGAREVELAGRPRGDQQASRRGDRAAQRKSSSPRGLAGHRVTALDVEGSTARGSRMTRRRSSADGSGPRGSRPARRAGARRRRAGRPPATRLRRG